MAYTLDKKLWYTADKSRVVEDGDSASAFLLGVAGQVISDEEAARLGLGLKPPETVTEKAALPAPNKKKTPSENKGA